MKFTLWDENHPGITIVTGKKSTPDDFFAKCNTALNKIRSKPIGKGLLKTIAAKCLMSGKKVFEILPKIDWDKGKAMRWIMQALKLSWSDVLVIYIGDDTTDEDAFRMVRTRGVGILVSDKPEHSAADFQLSSPEEVKKIFNKLVDSA